MDTTALLAVGGYATLRQAFGEVCPVVRYSATDVTKLATAVEALQNTKANMTFTTASMTPRSLPLTLLRN